MPEFVAASVVITALIAFRHYAARQVAVRRGRFIWALFVPTILGAAVTVWTGLRLLSSAQVMGSVLIVFGAVLATVELVLLRRAARAVSAASPEQDLTEVLVDPITDLIVVMTVAGIVFVVVGGVLLIVWPH